MKIYRFEARSMSFKPENNFTDKESPIAIICQYQ